MIDDAWCDPVIPEWVYPFPIGPIKVEKDQWFNRGRKTISPPYPAIRVWKPFQTSGANRQRAVFCSQPS